MGGGAGREQINTHFTILQSRHSPFQPTSPLFSHLLSSSYTTFLPHNSPSPPTSQKQKNWKDSIKILWIGQGGGERSDLLQEWHQRQRSFIEQVIIHHLLRNALPILFARNTIIADCCSEGKKTTQSFYINCFGENFLENVVWREREGHRIITMFFNPEK